MNKGPAPGLTRAWRSGARFARSAPMPATNIAELSVSELAFALKRTVEDAYGLVRVRGELSGFKKATSGHLYFSLRTTARSRTRSTRSPRSR